MRIRQHFVVVIDLEKEDRWHAREVWRCLDNYGPPDTAAITVTEADTDVAVAAAQRAVRTASVTVGGDA